MRHTTTTTMYELDGHTLMELIINELKVPNRIRGTFNVNFPSSYIIKVDEEGEISLFHHPERDGQEPEPFDLSIPQVFIETTEIEHD